MQQGHQFYRSFNIVLLTFSLCLPAIQSFASENRYSTPQWRSLDYEASLLFLTAKTHVEYHRQPSHKVNLRTPPDKYGQALAPAPEYCNEIRMTSSVPRKHSVLNFYYKDDLSALQRTTLDSGKRNRLKLYRFMEKGVYTFQATPKEGEESLSHERWTHKGDNFFSYPDNLAAQTVIADSTALFHILGSEAMRKPGDRLDLKVFIRKKLYDITIQADGHTYIDSAYIQESPAGKKEIDDQFKVLKVQIRPTGAPDEFEFMGLKGVITAYLDPKTHIVLRLAGKVDVLGTIYIELTKVQLK